METTAAIIQLLLVIILALLFYMSKKPKWNFFIFGGIFFLIALFIQLPLKILEYQFNQIPYLFFNFSAILITILAILVSEFTKYLSLKKYLKTKSLKNGIFFGMGWVGIESISAISILFYSFIFSIISLSFEPQYLISSSMYLWDFMFLLVINSLIMMYVISSVIKNNKWYLLYGILFASCVQISLLLVTNSIIIEVLFVVYSLLTLFYFNKLIK